MRLLSFQFEVISCLEDETRGHILSPAQKLTKGDLIMLCRISWPLALR